MEQEPEQATKQETYRQGDNAERGISEPYIISRFFDPVDTNRTIIIGSAGFVGVWDKEGNALVYERNVANVTYPVPANGMSQVMEGKNIYFNPA